MKSFKDYIGNRKIIEAETGMAVEKPKVKLVADYDGPTATAPDQGKNSVSYKPANAASDPNKGKDENGFANLGGKNLVYTPDTKGGDSKTTALGTTLKDNWPKLKSESWFEKTKKMDKGQFMKFVNESNEYNNQELPTINGEHPFPPEAIRYVAALSTKTPATLNNLVHEMKRAGNLGGLLKALLEHPESYEEITKLLSESDEGPKRCRQLNKAMIESVGPPMGMGDEDEGDPHHQNGFGHHDNDDDEHHDHDDDDDSDEPHDEFGQDDGDEEEDGTGDDDSGDNDDDEHLGDDDKDFDKDDDSNDEEDDGDDETFDNHHDDEEDNFGFGHKKEHTSSFKSLLKTMSRLK